MAVQIHFDPAGVPLLPHLILATKSGRMIREIPVNDVKFMDTLVSGSEFSFTVYREACLDENGEIDRAFWKKITDFKLAYCRDFDRWYELKVDMTESTSTSRSVTARSLGEAELSQINVYGIEVNTETDIERADYEPTVLYDESHPEKSLIDRLLYKAPHYRVEHVDESIQNVQRTFSFDGKTIYDSFSEVSQEIGCLFLYDCTKKEDGGIDRTISVYDLEYHCPVCGQRGEYMPVCTNCGNTTLPGYGTDTTVFVARENLAKEITYTTNTDAVKNCFRLEAGDDLMTAGIVACNPNGSQYIWYITDDMKADMTSELQDKLADYDDLYEYYQSESSYSPPSGLLDDYNDIVEKYQNTWRPDTSLAEKQMPASIVGYPALMKNYFDTIDLQMFLENEMMPSSQTSTTDAETEAAKLTSISLSPVAVANITSCTADTAASAVVGMAKCIVRGTYQVKATESSIGTVGQFLQWTGKLRVTNYGDEEDTAETGSITVVITNDLQKYIQQKIDRMINQTADDPTDISALFKLDIAPFTAELSKYCRTRLIAFRDACQAALDILIQQGVADAPSWVSEENDLYQTMYVPYLRKMSAIEAEIRTRSDEIGVVYGTVDNNGGILTDGMQTVLKKQVDTIRADLNFENYLGEELWQEFAGYRREDVYKNDNYISDGLSNYDLMIYAERFLNTARQEIFKSATMQHSIQASMANLLAMEEFQPLKQKFRVGNWIRVRADGDVYRLRLSEYTIDYSTWNLDVVFTDLKQGYSAASDLQSMLSAVKSMQTTYGSVTRQAKDGEKGLGMLDRWVNEGLALTTNIVGGAENQEFTMDESGFTGKELIPETGEYSPEQVKIISHGVYMTDDGWVTAKAALGRFRFLNPQNNFQEEEAFGVIADKLVGNLVLSQSIGIYNSDGSLTMDENGFTLITEHTGNQKVFNIKRHNQDDSYDDIVSLDASGNLVLQAYSTTGEMNTAIETSANGVKTYVSDNYSTKANTVKAAVVEYIVWDYGDDEHAPPNNDSHWSTATPSWTSGKYIWQHTKTTSGSNVISYSSPACIQGASGQSGQDGYNSAVVYLYQRATATPSAPSGSLTYTFSTGVLSGTLGSWSQDIPSGSNPIYAIAATAASRTDTDTIASNEWSTAVVLAQNGEDGDPGTNGLNSATVRLYQRAASAPSKPSTSLTYTFATGVLANIPTGWSQSIPASDGNPCWVTQATAVANTATDTIAASEWSTVSKLVEDGEQGEDGVGISSIEPEYYLSTSDQTPTGGSWSTDQPEWENGKYIWTRSKITWDDSTQADPHIGYTDPVLASAINGANEQAYNTNQILVTDYSSTTQTKDMISNEVGKTTIEIIDGINKTSSNLCPYPLEPHIPSTYQSYYTITVHDDGKYTIERLSSNIGSFSLRAGDGTTTILEPGTYTFQLYEDVESTNSMSVDLSYNDGTSHSVRMTKSQLVANRFTYTLTRTFETAVTKIEFGVNLDSTASGYKRVWWPKINVGDEALAWEGPNETNKRYPTSNLCPIPMVAIYATGGGSAPVTVNPDGTFSGTVTYTSSKYGIRLSAYNQKFETGTYSITVIEESDSSTFKSKAMYFYQGTGEYQMTGTESGDKKIYKCQLNISSSATTIYFRKFANSSDVGEYSFKWSIIINAGTEYLDWETPTSIGVEYCVSDAYSKIEQTAESISMKVDKDGIISAINMSPEQITIDASRVNITGFLTVSDVSSTGTVEIYGGRIKGGTITLGGNNNGNGQLSIVNASNQTLLTANNSEFSYYCRSSTSSFLIKNNSGNNLLEANTNGLTVYCRSTTAGLYLKDSSGNTIMASNSYGIALYKGSIQGPTIYVGGNGNGDGAIYVRNSSGTTIVTLNNSGIYTSNTTINASGISTSSLTASSYINFNCSSSSYLKVPYYSGSGYFELSSSNGFYSYCYGSTIQFGTNGHFNIGDYNGSTEIYGENIITNWISCYEIDATEMYAAYVKPRVVDTPDFGKRLLYAFETPTPMFADVGSAVIDDTGTVYIFIDDIFAETVVTDIEYQVFIQKYGEGNCWVSERNPNYITVSGTPGLEFGWEIHAKQVDTNQERLTPFIKGDKGTMRSMLKGNYDTLATDFIRKYYNEIETNERSEI